MWSLLLPLLTSFVSPDGILGKFLGKKAEIQKAEQDYRLAVLVAEKERAVAQIQSDSADTANMLSSTSREFKQGVYYWFSAIILFSIIFQDRADALWSNFALMPEWFQNLYVIMTLVIWGINPVKNGVTWLTDSVSNGLQSRREYKLETTKAKAVAQVAVAQAVTNDKVFFDTIRPELFPSGMTAEQVELFNKALKLRDGRHVGDI